jgi:hypothetical protein
MSKEPNAFNDPVLFTVWAAVMASCLWAVIAAWESGWIVGFPIAIAIGATRILAFGKER